MSVFTEMFPAFMRPLAVSVDRLNEMLLDSAMGVAGAWSPSQNDFNRYLPGRPAYSAIQPRPARIVLVSASLAHTGTASVPAPQPQGQDKHLPNAAVAILTNPAMAAGVARASDSSAEPEEVRDDVADDIAAEIEREAQEEIASGDRAATGEPGENGPC